MHGTINGTGRLLLESPAEEISALSAQDNTVMIFGRNEATNRLLAAVLHDLGPRNERPFLAMDCLTGEIMIECDDSLMPVRRRIDEVVEAVRDGSATWLTGGTILLNNLIGISHETFDVLHSKIRGVLGCRVVGNMYKPKSRGVVVREFTGEDMVSIALPPLKQNERYIRFLSGYFLAKANLRWTRNITGIAADTQKRLMEFIWPGDIEELRDSIYQSVMIAGDGEELPVAALPHAIRDFRDDAQLLRKAIILAEHRLIQKALDQAMNNKRKAADILKISRKTLYSKIRLYREYAA